MDIKLIHKPGKENVVLNALNHKKNVLGWKGCECNSGFKSNVH
jgi:hypothetical protein